ncbi:MAG TPA: AMP-binding protein, partial [Baekduia sp.]|nr:AMP-binding protein [Baekduia sp.]
MTHAVVAPSMPSYEHARAAFTWDAARADLDGLPGGGLNICHEALDRHADGPHGDRVAVRWLAAEGGRRDITYRQLRDDAARFAGLLAELEVGRGERVVSLLGRVPELLVAALGTLRHGAVFCPLYEAYGPQPVHRRLRLARARVLVTTRERLDHDVTPRAAGLERLQHVLLADSDLPGRLAAARPAPVAATSDGDPALMHYTSGTTGTPMGVVHGHGAVIAQHATARAVLDVRPGDVVWCTADPGWITWTVYGLIAPLTCGATVILDEGELDPGRWYATLERERVGVLYTAPTAIHTLMRAGDAPPAGRDLSALRLVASAGEPLTPGAVLWGERALGRPIHDTWWQTQTGAIMLANVAAEPIRLGSMGRPVPGVEAAIVRRADDGRGRRHPAAQPEILHEPDAEGELALRTGWPSMFSCYLSGDDQP